MELPKAGCEYLHWTVYSKQPVDAPVSVAFLRVCYEIGPDVAWHEAEWVDDPGTARTLRVLVAGPVIEPLPLEAVQLTAGEYQSFVRVEQGFETIIRKSEGVLTVK